MKRLFTFFTGVMSVFVLFAQVPNKFTYQAVVRNTDNSVVANATIGMQISILQGTADGTAVYVETQSPTTNSNGLVSVEIGGDAITVVSGSFSGINWSTGSYFIKTEIDPSGGASYTITGTSQLLSVPYALYAQTADSFPGLDDLVSKQILQDSILNIKAAIFSGNYVDLTNPPNIMDSIHKYMAANPQSLTLAIAQGANLGVLANSKSFTKAELVDAGLTIDTLIDLGVTLDELLEDSVDFQNFLDEGLTQFPDYITDIEGNSYNVVLINNQLWMAENLRSTKYADGTSIPNITNNTDWANLGNNDVDKAYCWYNNDSATYAQTYGALYTYAAATNGDSSGVMVQGICPDGWHVPSDNEWYALFKFLCENGYNYDGTVEDGTQNTDASRQKIGKALSSTTGWDTSTDIGDVGNDPASNNLSGFSALASGFRDYSNGMFYESGTKANFLTSTENQYDDESRGNFWLNYAQTTVSLGNLYTSYKSNGASVRCIKD